MNERIKELADPVVIADVMNRKRMNEPIKILMYEANKSVNPGAWTLEDFSQKFAELIVRDCVGILEPKSRYMGEGPEVLKDKIRQIKKHFGVEK
jgi:hypothetical protein